MAYKVDEMEKNSPPQLPTWIPDNASVPYWAVYNNGGYSDPRVAAALECLYHSEKLRFVWEGSLANLQLSPDRWSSLIGPLVERVTCAPEKGQRTTSDSPGRKHQLREQQKNVDELLAAGAKKARELEQILVALIENGGEMPGEIYSGMALIRSSIDGDGMSRATCQDAFTRFDEGLSSYAYHHFPSTEMILGTLAGLMEMYPRASEVLAKEPWLASSHSSWIDYLREIKDVIDDLRERGFDMPNFSVKEWRLICSELLALPVGLYDQAVHNALKSI